MPGRGEPEASAPKPDGARPAAGSALAGDRKVTRVDVPVSWGVACGWRVACGLARAQSRAHPPDQRFPPPTHPVSSAALGTRAPTAWYLPSPGCAGNPAELQSATRSARVFGAFPAPEQARPTRPHADGNVPTGAERPRQRAAALCAESHAVQHPSCTSRCAGARPTAVHAALAANPEPRAPWSGKMTGGESCLPWARALSQSPFPARAHRKGGSRVRGYMKATAKW